MYTPTSSVRYEFTSNLSNLYLIFRKDRLRFTMITHLDVPEWNTKKISNSTFVVIKS